MQDSTNVDDLIAINRCRTSVETATRLENEAQRRGLQINEANIKHMEVRRTAYNIGI